MGRDSGPTIDGAPSDANGDGRRIIALLTTDIEGSTSRWERFPESMLEVLMTHDALLLAAIEEHGGRMVSHTGDGLNAAFDDPAAAVEAAATIQRRMTATDWGAVDGLRVRAAVHVGPVVERNGDLHGWAFNVVARLNSIGHGGQTLLSADAVDAVGSALPGGLGLASLGRYRLRDVATATEVFQLTGPGLDRTFPPLRSGRRIHAVARPTTPLIGRAADVAAARAGLDASRLVALVGPRGVGTSRLAAEVATDGTVTRAFAHGAIRLDLAPVTPGQAVPTLATALGVTIRADRGPLRSVVDWLSGQSLLLLVEHGERHLDELTPLAEAVLAEAPDVSVLWTGSRPLGLAGEAIHRVGPLAPGDAEALFRDRAAAAGAPAHDLDLFPTARVRELCERLEGLPLSVEATAAGAAVHSMAELWELVSRPGSTATGDTAALAEAVAVAVDALPDALRSMLVAATAFAGRFDRTAFAAVCAPGVGDEAVAAALAELANRSLIDLAEAPEGTRFRLLNMVAEQTRRMGSTHELDGAGDRLRRYVLDLVTNAAGALRGRAEIEAHHRLAHQFDSIRRVFDRAVESDDLATAAAICTELWDYGFMRLRADYFQWSERVLDRFDGEGRMSAEREALLAPVLGVAALGAWIGDDLEAVHPRATRALALEAELGLDFDLPARLALINAAVYSGADAAPPQIYLEQERYQKDRPELYFHVNVEVQNCVMATWLGADDAALRRGVEALRLAQRSENPSSLAFALWGLATALGPDDPLQAESLLGRALEQAREVGNGWLTALTQLSLAGLRRRTGTGLDAAPLLVDLLDLLTRAGHRSHLWATLRLCGLVLGDLGNDGLGVQIRHWVDEAKLAMPAHPADQVELDDHHRRIVEARGEAWVERTKLLASAWTTDAVVELVRRELTTALAGAEPPARAGPAADAGRD